MRHAIVEAGRVVRVLAGRVEGLTEEVPDGAAEGWVRTGDTWAPPAPALSVDDALAAIDAHSAALLARGVVISGVRLSLDTADRLDWLGLLTMRSALLAAAGGAIPVVGVDGGVLVLSSEEQIASVAGQLAAYRLWLQAISAGARQRVRAAADDAARLAEVAAYQEVTP